MDGFNILRSDRKDQAGGGVCLYSKASLLVKPRMDLTESAIESCWGEIHCQSGTCLIGTIYRPPSEPVRYWDCLDDHLHSAIMPGKNVIICGDININTNPTAPPDPQLHYLSDLVASYSLYPGVHQPTRFSANSAPTKLDQFYNTFDPLNMATVIPIAFSDHAAVLSEFQLSPVRSTVTSGLRRHYRNINHDQFKADLVQQDFCEIDGSPTVMWTEWASRFLQVLDRHAPLAPSPRRKKKSVPWMNRQLLHLLTKRNRLHRRWLSDGTEHSHSAFKAARREATSYNRQQKETYYQSKFRAASGNTKQTWHTIKELSGKHRQSQPPQCSVDAIRNTFAEIVEDASRPVHLSFPYGPASSTDLTAFAPVSIARVRKLLERLNPAKSSGDDDISAALLRAHADVLAPSLTLIFNKSLREGIFPAQMKSARISPLFKGGDPSMPKNHRPVSLLSIASKVLERIVHEQLTRYLVQSNLFPPTQFGYRSHHSTSDALVLAVEGICEARMNRLNTGVAFVDMSKAFDKVKHQTLVQDLFELGICDTALCWLVDYLSDREQYVQVGQTRSLPYTSYSGVPQGSVLGPLLFIVYARGIAEELSPFNVGAIQFADDISIRCSRESAEAVSAHLSAAVQHLATWLKGRGLILNERKTQILPIPPSPSQALELHVICNGQTLPVVKTAKYLGLHFDSDMSWNTMTSHVARRVAAKIGLLNRSAACLPFSCRVQFFRSFILSEFDYASAAYAPFLSSYQDKRLNSLFKRAARSVCKAAPRTHTAPLLERMNAHTLSIYTHMHILVFIWRCLNKSSSTLFASFFTRSPSLRTRGGNSKLLIIPVSPTASSAKRISHAGAILWNQLPDTARLERKRSTFKSLSLAFLLGSTVN